MELGMLIIGQISVMVVVILIGAPCAHDLSRMTSRMLAGRSIFRRPARWQEIRHNWRQRNTLTVLPVFSIIASSFAIALTPFFTTRYAFLGIGVPMLDGILLCMALLPTWHVALHQGPGGAPTKHIEDLLLSSVQLVVIMLSLLALTGLIIAVGYPFPADLADHTAVRPDRFYAPLRGSLFCMAWVFIFTLIQSPIAPNVQAPLIQSQYGRDRALFKFGHDLNTVGWYLLTSNLVYPQDILAVAQANMHFPVLSLVGAVLRIIVLTILIAAWRTLQPHPGAMPRIVLLCVALLTVFSGRLVR